ncbi:MAG: N-acetyltransferase family protein [Xanthobacteraceae bacterium]|jgi:phosphinothricin acetyltransferase
MNETTAARHSFLIRPAAPGDIAAITSIYAFAVTHGTATFEIDPPDDAEMARRHAALAAGGYPYLVAEHGGAIAGYAYAGTYRARPAYSWSVEDSIYIAPDFQRQGIGSALLMRLIAESELRGFRQMIAVIGDSAQAPSIAVHAKAGFAHIGTLRAVGFKHGRWLDTVLMQRPLGSGQTAPP